MAAAPRPPAVCANCGADIPRHAKACPACGADERTGWRETDLYDGLDLPPEAWDDAPTPRRKNTSGSRNVGGLKWYWWATALFVLLALGLAFLGLR